jgi:hypothetical protein
MKTGGHFPKAIRARVTLLKHKGIPVTEECHRIVFSVPFTVFTTGFHEMHPDFHEFFKCAFTSSPFLFPFA